MMTNESESARSFKCERDFNLYFFISILLAAIDLNQEQSYQKTLSN